MPITVTEKENIKGLIESRIDKEIEKIRVANRIAADAIKVEARQQAIDALGIANEMAELQAIKAEIERLTSRKQEVEKGLVERLDLINQRDGYYAQSNESKIEKRINTAAYAFEQDGLRKHHQLGRVVELEMEKDKLMESVWIATSSTQVKQLFDAVNNLLGISPTQLEQMAKSIPADDR